MLVVCVKSSLSTNWIEERRVSFVTLTCIKIVWLSVTAPEGYLFFSE